MNRIVLIMDTGRPVDLQAAQWFLAHGDTVLLCGCNPDNGAAGVEYFAVDPLNAADLRKIVQVIQVQYDRIDILVVGAVEHPADGEIGTGHDYDAFTEVLTRNVMCCRKMMEAFQPLLEKGMKRIACITEAESSNGWCSESTNMAYSASLAAINMLGRMMFNRLRPDGFTFRWYCQGEEKGGMCAAAYIASALCYDPKEPYTHSDENRFVLRDAFLREISW